ncbi:MAG: DNA repair protein RadC [Nitrospinota bacterium]
MSDPLKEKINLASGHRRRLRKRLLTSGGQAFEDYELLELLLTYSLKRVDTKTTAKTLIRVFGSFASVFDQPLERLIEVKGVGPETGVFILSVRQVFERYFQERVEKKERISSPEEVVDFARLKVGARERECLMVLFLNTANLLLTYDIITEGTVDKAAVYPREILKKALLTNATGLILVHNHPGGDPSPSENDHDVTGRLEQLSAEFNIRILDHLIVSPRKAFSMKKGVFL